MPTGSLENNQEFRMLINGRFQTKVEEIPLLTPETSIFDGNGSISFSVPDETTAKYWKERNENSWWYRSSEPIRSRGIWYNFIDFFGIIEDVEVLVPNKVVQVTFSGGRKEKAVCDDIDTFSLETGITVCLCKYLFGKKGYNKELKKAVKIYTDKQKQIEKDKLEEERIAAKKAKKKAKREARLAKKEQAEREKAISIQTEAYVRAMEEMEKRKKAD